MRGCASIIVGFAAFVLFTIVAGQLLGPLKCRDGWASASIGSQGACSWHGGVDRSRDGLSFIFMIGAGLVGAGFYATRLAQRLDKSPPKPPSPPVSRSGGPSLTQSDRTASSPLMRRTKPIVPARPGAKACPHCGSGMRLRTARRGARRGKRFWGCSRYPDCTGTISTGHE